jgi:hypothetical protein
MKSKPMIIVAKIDWKDYTIKTQMSKMIKNPRIQFLGTGTQGMRR